MRHPPDGAQTRRWAALPAFRARTTSDRHAAYVSGDAGVIAGLNIHSDDAAAFDEHRARQRPGAEARSMIRMDVVTV